MVGRISKRTVDALTSTRSNVLLWDAQLPRFGLKVTPAGAKVYVVQYRVGRRLRRYTIGRHGAPWTPDTARKEALRLLALVEAGNDPVETKQSRRTASTIRDLAGRFLSEHVEAKCKASTAELYRGLLANVILPALGHRRVTDVTRADVARLHHRHRDTPHYANRSVAVISKMFNLAERWGLRPDGSNPSRHIDKFRETKRERYLSADELSRLGAALDAAETEKLTVPSSDGPVDVRLSLYAVAAIRLLLLTGARRGEILGLEWRHVDLESRYIRLPDSKTGPKVIHLNAPARAVLSRLPRVQENTHVIVGRRAGAALVNLKDSWAVLRTVAKLDGVRLHDLRHSFASVAVSEGLGLPVIGGLLGHTHVATTQRYAHLSADLLRQAGEQVGARLAAALERRGQIMKESGKSNRTLVAAAFQTTI